MVPVLEAVPNFSEGRDLGLVRELVGLIEAEGAEVLDWSADPDHHRSVITFIGDPASVETAALAAGRLAIEAIDLRAHSGLHPRVGALDVLPFVPLAGLSMMEACRSARRVAEGLGEAGVPAYLYGAASDPPGRGLSELRRGGFEALREGFPAGRAPDVVPAGWSHAGAHPTAGVTCVGARELLLAWNVFVSGVELSRLKELATELREGGGGFRGLRALAFELPSQGRRQISMNLEDLATASPFAVYERIESWVRECGGAVSGTQVIGMIPDRLTVGAAVDRLGLEGGIDHRLLTRRLSDHVSGRASREAEELLEVIHNGGGDLPAEVLEAVERLTRLLKENPAPAKTP